MQTEIAFTLPRGYVDAARRRPSRGPDAARHGSRRDRAAAGGRGAPEPGVPLVLLLARTITRIGDVTDITPQLIEGLFAADFDHLQRLYERVNSDGDAVGVVSCPACAHEFEVDMTEVEDGRLGK